MTGQNRNAAPLQYVRITCDPYGPGGEVTDQDDRPIGGVTGVTIDLDPRKPAAASIDVVRPEVDVTVAAERIRWHGLEHVPTAALRGELGRRLPATDQPLLPHGRYGDLLAISYDLDDGDARDQDVAQGIRQVLVDDEIAVEHGTSQ